MALLEFDDDRMQRARIKVIGCGGGGGNAINTMMESRLEGVDFIDSTGLGVLISGLKRVRTHDGRFALVCTEPRILKVFDITGLLAVFNVCSSVDEAIAPEGDAPEVAP